MVAKELHASKERENVESKTMDFNIQSHEYRVSQHRAQICASTMVSWLMVRSFNFER